LIITFIRHVCRIASLDCAIGLVFAVGIEVCDEVGHEDRVSKVGVLEVARAIQVVGNVVVHEHRFTF